MVQMLKLCMYGEVGIWDPADTGRVYGRWGTPVAGIAGQCVRAHPATAGRVYGRWGTPVARIAG